MLTQGAWQVLICPFLVFHQWGKGLLRATPVSCLSILRVMVWQSLETEPHRTRLFRSPTTQTCHLRGGSSQTCLPGSKCSVVIARWHQPWPWPLFAKRDFSPPPLTLTAKPWDETREPRSCRFVSPWPEQQGPTSCAE